MGADASPRFVVTEHPPPLMRPQAPEVWSHLVAFVRARLLERHANPDVMWNALDELTETVIDSYSPRASAPGESDIDAEEAMWHLAAIWRDHPEFDTILNREYDRAHFLHKKYGWPLPDREEWIREWTP